jgi:tRNA A37 N6-isopentenylltransferase MiaA
VRESEVWERQEQEREMKRQSRKDRSEEVKASEGKEKRFKTLIFWLHAPQEILDPRLDGRIDRMIEVCSLTCRLNLYKS